MSRALALLGALLGVGCFPRVDVAPQRDAGVGFREVICAPDILGGVQPEREQMVECTFRLEGFVTSAPVMTCEDASGLAIDCEPFRPYSGVEVFEQAPFYDVGLLRVRAGHRLNADGWDTIVLVAESGANRAEASLGIFTVPPKSGVDSPPHVRVACDGAVSPAATVTVGERLTCLVYVDDADPGADLRFEVLWSGHADMPPRGGRGVEVWSWDPRPEDVPSQSFRFTLVAAPQVSFTLVVEVLPPSG